MNTPAAPAPEEGTRKSLEKESLLETEGLPFLIQVIAETGEPLPEARIFSEKGKTSRLLGETDRKGKLAVPMSQASFEAVLARKQGFVPRRRKVGPAPGKEVTLTLAKGVGLFGKVVRKDGTPPLHPVRVLAWPKSADWSAVELYEHLEEHDNWPELLISKTDDLGRFQFTEATPSLAYRVTAGGEGYVPVEDPLPARPFEPVRIEVSNLYGIVVALVGPDGGSLRTFPLLQGEGPGFGIEGLSTGTLAIFGKQIVAAGLPADDLFRNSLMFPFYYATDEELSALKPIASFYCRIPGYKRVSETFSLPRIRKDVSVRTITLIPTASSWGSLTLRFQVPNPEWFLPSGFFYGPGRLILYSESGTRSDPAIKEFFSGEKTFENIPAGVYRVRFRSVDDFRFLYPSGEPVRIEIGPDSPKEPFVIDLTGTGILSASLIDAAGKNYHGEARFTLKSKQTQALADFHFRASPYLMKTIPPGRYEVTLFFPQLLQNGGRLKKKVLVLADETTDFEFP
ncbi:MAG: hypothetical protein ACE5H3_01990 [Planctomycetota bacterium]